jgi:transposase-like protein
MEKKTTGSLPKAAKPGGRAPKRRRRLAPSEKYEVFTSVLTNSATQAELAEKHKIDRSTIRSICQTAKQGALDALAAAVPGRRGKTAEQLELEQARDRIAALEATGCAQAKKQHLIEGKGSWD